MKLLCCAWRRFHLISGMSPAYAYQSQLCVLPAHSLSPSLGSNMEHGLYMIDIPQTLICWGTVEADNFNSSRLLLLTWFFFIPAGRFGMRRSVRRPGSRLGPAGTCAVVLQRWRHFVLLVWMFPCIRLTFAYFNVIFLLMHVLKIICFSTRTIMITTLARTEREIEKQ